MNCPVLAAGAKVYVSTFWGHSYKPPLARCFHVGTAWAWASEWPAPVELRESPVPGSGRSCQEDKIPWPAFPSEPVSSLSQAYVASSFLSQGYPGLIS